MTKRTGFIITMAFLIPAGISFLVFLNKISKSMDRNEAVSINVIIFLCIACWVNVMKALRLYILIFGKEFKKSEYIKQYIKTTFINMMLPLKAGEIYRGYCIGNMIGSVLDGYIIVLFDRFVDTFALMSIASMFIICGKDHITAVYVILAALLIICMLIYHMFRPLYQYWNHFLIFKKSSMHTLAGLSFLKACKDSFENAVMLLKGRFIILYLMSVLAWMTDAGVLFIRQKSKDSVKISNYLANILSGNWDENNMFYISACLIVLGSFSILWLFMKMGEKKKWES